MADSKVFDVKFDFSMSKSPRGQVLSRFGWIGDGFIRGRFFKKNQKIRKNNEKPLKIKSKYGKIKCFKVFFVRPSVPGGPAGSVRPGWSGGRNSLL